MAAIEPMAQSERERRVENIAAFLAFAIDGHDQSWACVAPEVEENYRYQAEGLMRCAEGAEWEAVLMGEDSET
jgi:hypothetical protein